MTHTPAAAYDRAKANRAAERFELTREDYDALSHLHVSHLALALQDMVNRFDFDRRPIVGVWGAVSPRGKLDWQNAWLENVDAHMERAWAALRRAHERFAVGEAA